MGFRSIEHSRRESRARCREESLPWFCSMVDEDGGRGFFSTASMELRRTVRRCSRSAASPLSAHQRRNVHPRAAWRSSSFAITESTLITAGSLALLPACIAAPAARVSPMHASAITEERRARESTLLSKCPMSKASYIL